MDPMLLELLKGMRTDISEMRQVQTEQGAVIAEVKIGYQQHHQRSLYNEELVKATREDSKKMFESLQSEINPIKTHVAAWGGVAKGLAIIGSLATITAAVVGLIKFLGH
jgi:hypothetical protein